MSDVAAARAGNASVPWPNQVKLLAVFLYFTAKIVGTNNEKKDDAQDYHDETLNRFCYKDGEIKSVHENVTKNSREKKMNRLWKEKKKETYPINI